MFDINFKNYGFMQLMGAMVLNVLGLIFIQSAMTSGISSFINQLFISIFSLLLCILISLLDLKKFLSRPTVFYGICLVTLLLVLLIGNMSGRNSQRWIEVPIIHMQLQPSEFAKLFVILFMSKLIEKEDIGINRFSVLLKIILYFIVPFLFIFLQPNLSSSLILMAIFLGMLFGSKLKTKWFLIGGGIGILIILFLILSVKFNYIEHAPFLKEYQKQRIISFMTPTTKDEGKYQQENAVIAIGSGQLFGKGINNDSNQSVKNGNWLAEEQNDFIFAVVGEEIGFIGSTAIILIYMYLIISCLYVSAHQREEYKKLICVGVATWLGFQSFVNIGVATSILPNTGVPLPFFSQGGSSLMSIYMALGFVLNIRRDMR